MDNGHSEQIATSINYDQALLSRARKTVEVLAQEPTLEFSGESTPHILFHGFSSSTRARNMFSTGRLNSDGKLLWFTPSPHRAASAYGMRIEGEEKEEIERLGLQHHQEERHDDWYQANRIKEATKLALVIFPHEETDLGKWIEDRHPVSVFNDSREYITDLNIDLNSVLIIRINQIQPYIREIEQGRIASKKEFIEKLGLTYEQQERTRETLKAYFDRLYSSFDNEDGFYLDRILDSTVDSTDQT